jgi:hypothetical protein
MIGAIEVLDEFIEASRIGREHVLPKSLQERPSRAAVPGINRRFKQDTCRRCGRVKCRCGKKWKWKKKSP